MEELVLLTVGSLHEKAYGVSIMEEIKTQTGRELNISAAHAILIRLEDKVFLRSSMGGATSERGGRRKRYFTLTAAGKKALDTSMQCRLELYQRIPQIAYKFSY